MHKDALRERLAEMSNKDGLALAITETAFLDVNQMHKFTSIPEALIFLASWTPIEAVALLSQVEPLVASLLVWYINRLAGPTYESNLSAEVITKLRQVAELTTRLGVVS